MSEFQILLTIQIAGLGFIGALLLIIWNRIEKLDDRINKLEKDMIEVKTLMRIIENSLSSHGHCLFNQSHQEKKAE